MNSSSSSRNNFEDERELEQQFEQLFESQNQRLQAICDARVEAVIERSLSGGRQGRESVRGRDRRMTRQVVERNREDGQQRLWNDYFADNPVYTEDQFRQRFRMHRPLFMRIVDTLQNMQYFRQRRDAIGRMGLSPLQKCTAAIRMLAYGCAADAVDEYLRMGATTARDCLNNFIEGIIINFGNEYLRSPTEEDTRRLLMVAEQRGFPGMLGSIDCMHWEWKNCPTAWRGMFQGRGGKATLVLEAVASQDLWIWHAFFGVPGVCNDLNVL